MIRQCLPVEWEGEQQNGSTSRWRDDSMRNWKMRFKHFVKRIRRDDESSMTLTGSITYQNVRGIMPALLGVDWIHTALNTTNYNGEQRACALWESLQLSGLGWGHFWCCWFRRRARSRSFCSSYSFTRSFGASNVPSAGGKVPQVPSALTGGDAWTDRWGGYLELRLQSRRSCESRKSYKTWGFRHSH